MAFHSGNSEKNLFNWNQYGIQKVANFWMINMTVLIVWQFAYGIISRTLISSTYSTQCRELLIAFHSHSGNFAQNSSLGNQYGIQKITSVLLINKACNAVTTKWKSLNDW